MENLQAPTTKEVQKAESKTAWNVYDYVNSIIIESLGNIQNGDCTYLIANTGRPQNLISKTIYKGVNYFLLSMIASAMQYSTNNWATFGQIKKAGGTLKKGAKSWQVLFYQFSYFLEGKKIDEKKYKDLQQKKVTGLEKRAFIKYYKVFNFDFVEGIEIETVELNEHLENERLSRAESLVKNTKANIREVVRETACYIPAKDLICMPPISYFLSIPKYYNTIFHELSHWTGNETRLNRELSQEREKYAFEELIAELSASYLCTEVGIESELISSVSYIEGWLTALKNDKTFVYKAMLQAQKSANFIVECVE